MRDALYLQIRKISFRYDYFIFFDVPSYLADQLFIRHQVRVWFGSAFTREDSPYVGIFCHVRKCDKDRFLAALEDLKKSMLICGHTDYEEAISNFLDQLERSKTSHENDTARQAEQGQPAQLLRGPERILARHFARDPRRPRQEGVRPEQDETGKPPRP